MTLPTRWVGGLVLGSTLDYPDRIDLVIETPDGTVVRVTGEVSVARSPSQELPRKNGGVS